MAAVRWAEGDRGCGTSFYERVGRCLQAGASPLDPFSRVAAPGRRGTYDTALESFLLSRTPPSPQPREIPVLQPAQTPRPLPKGSPPYRIVAALVVCAAPLAGSMDTHAKRITATVDSTGSVIDYTGSVPFHDSRSRSPATGWSGLSDGSCVEGRRLDGKRLGVAREEDKFPVGLCRSGGPESNPPAIEALMGVAQESPGERTFRKVGGALPAGSSCEWPSVS